MQKIKTLVSGETISALLVMALLVIFLRPPGLLMPKSTEMLVVALFILSCFAFLGFIWKEHAQDEREEAHQYTAARVSFFIGSLILTLGIILQALMHEIDPWLVATLGIMVLTKIVTRIYSNLVQ